MPLISPLMPVPLSQDSVQTLREVENIYIILWQIYSGLIDAKY